MCFYMKYLEAWPEEDQEISRKGNKIPFSFSVGLDTVNLCNFIQVILITLESGIVNDIQWIKSILRNWLSKISNKIKAEVEE